MAMILGGIGVLALFLAWAALPLLPSLLEWRRRTDVKPLRVVMVAMEMSQLVKVGGLGDVLHSLSEALLARGHDVTVILPAYRGLLGEITADETTRGRMDFAYAGGRRRQRFLRARPEGVGARLFLLDDPAFSRRDGIYVDPETREAREMLRAHFLSADMGISGGNFLVAETGSVALVTNEGNGRMVTTVPKVHVVITGVEKVIPTLEDLATLKL